MTPKELLRAINLPDDYFHINWAQDTMDLAAVIERDTPKKPIRLKGSVEIEFMCPACLEESHWFTQDNSAPKVCAECGQRLDWNEE